MKQNSLRGLGLLGIILFVPLFIFTFADPHLIEKSGKSFIQWKLQKETDKKIDTFRLPEAGKFEKLLGKKAANLRKQTEEYLTEIKAQLKADSPSIIAAQIAKMRNLDCECRKKWEQHLRTSMKLQIASLKKAKAKLIDYSQAKYMEIVKKLTLDVRIFLGANAVIFITLFMVSFLKPHAINHLFLPSTLMLVSTIICSYFYIFEQNWFYTIIYNDYTGFGYIGYLAFVFAILCDIVFNKGRVTTEILNAILSAIGRAGSLVPC